MEKRNSNYFEFMISKQVPNILLHQSQAHSFQEDSRVILLGKIPAVGQHKECRIQQAVCAYLLAAGAAETIKEHISENLLWEQLTKKCQ